MKTSLSFPRPLIREKRSLPNGTKHHTLDCLMYTDRAKSDESPDVFQVGILGIICPMGHSHRFRARLVMMILMHLVIGSLIAKLIPLRYM